MKEARGSEKAGGGNRGKRRSPSGDRPPKTQRGGQGGSTNGSRKRAGAATGGRAKTAAGQARTKAKSGSRGGRGDNNPNLVDMVFGRVTRKTLDSDTEITETQKRVWTALKKGYNYSDIINESDQFLRRNVSSKIDMMVMYVDLVGSTRMALEMPMEKIITIINSFSQEMAAVITQHDGYVLKFVGDAVIGYFVTKDDALKTADNTVGCAKSMISVIQKGINPILGQYDYPELMIKVGVDFGQAVVVRYGTNPEKSHIDLLGPVMNMAAKIQGIAKPDQILIGRDVYKKLHPSLQNEFSPVTWRNNEWKYRTRLTGEIYRVYKFKGSV